MFRRIRERLLLFAKQCIFNLFHHGLKIRKIDGYYVRLSVVGKDNRISFGSSSYLNYPEIIIHGHDNVLYIGKNNHIGPGCSFLIEGNNLRVEIGDCCSFNNTVHFCCQENDVKIVVGTNCMFSNNIIVRTSDSHPIFDRVTKNRLNCAKDVIIGDHVWVAPNAKLLKGAVVGSGSIIGSNALVTKEIPSNCLAVGMPAIVVRHNIEWSSEPAFEI